MVLDRSARLAWLEGMDVAGAASPPAFTGLPLGYDPDAPFHRAEGEARQTDTRIRIERRRRPIVAWSVGARALAALVALVVRA